MPAEKYKGVALIWDTASLSSRKASTRLHVIPEPARITTHPPPFQNVGEDTNEAAAARSRSGDICGRYALRKQLPSNMGRLVVRLALKKTPRHVLLRAKLLNMAQALMQSPNEYTVMPARSTPGPTKSIMQFTSNPHEEAPSVTSCRFIDILPQSKSRTPCVGTFMAAFAAWLCVSAVDVEVDVGVGVGVGVALDLGVGTRIPLVGIIVIVVGIMTIIALGSAALLSRLVSVHLGLGSVTPGVEEWPGGGSQSLPLRVRCQ